MPDGTQVLKIALPKRGKTVSCAAVGNSRTRFANLMLLRFGPGVSAFAWVWADYLYTIRI
jgi:hypothetical protein